MSKSVSMERNLSGMHPGVINGRRVFDKVNTCKPSKGHHKPATKITHNFDRRQSAWQATIKSIGAAGAAAYRKPGSWNPKRVKR